MNLTNVRVFFLLLLFQMGNCIGDDTQREGGKEKCCSEQVNGILGN